MAIQPAPQAWSQAPPAPTEQSNPMAGHVKAVAVIDLVFAGLTFIAALGVIFAFGVGAAAVNSGEAYGAPEWVADMLSAMAFVLGAIFAAIGVLYLLAGLRLLAFRRSGKALGVASAVVQLIVGVLTVMGGGLGLIPLAAGIYALVILTRSDTDRLLVNP
jgi:hypothetical protein